MRANPVTSRFSGFTLLEVLVVLTIMAFLMVTTTRSIQQALKNKEKIQIQVSDTSQVRDSLKVMERDINLAFHYTDYELEIRELIKKKRLAAAQPQPGASTTTTLPGSPPPVTAYNPNDPRDPLNQKDEHRLNPETNFIGAENSLYFATLNSARVREGEQQADFVKVGYLLKGCRSLTDSSTTGTSQCLVRRSSPIVEGDITKGGEDIVLLENVTEFKLRYFGKGKQDWVSSWDTKNGDGIAKGRFPDAVEISLTVEKGNKEPKKKISMQIVVPIRFTNNSAQDQKNAQAKQNGGGQSGSSSNDGGNM